MAAAVTKSTKIRVDTHAEVMRLAAVEGRIASEVIARAVALYAQPRPVDMLRGAIEAVRELEDVLRCPCCTAPMESRAEGARACPECHAMPGCCLPDCSRGPRRRTELCAALATEAPR